MLARLLVSALAAITLAAGAANAGHAGTAGLRVLSHRQTDPGQRTVDQIEALRRQLVVLVPAGARVLVGRVPPGWLGWEQRIVEVVTLEHRRVAVDRAGADYRVSIVEDPASPDGSGLRMTAEALR